MASPALVGAICWSGAASADRRSGGRGDGYGLGLAIVNALAQAHHATLSTSARPEGGLAVTVRFGQHPNL
jgi:signal transduction histidine kinase